MLTLPIPLIVALLLSALCLHLVLSPGRTPLLAALLATTAAQGLLISLVQHYDLTVLRPLQPLLAVAIPPLAWLTFQASLVRPLTRADALHLSGPAFVLFCLLAAPATLDLVVPGLFAAYGIAILWHLRSTSADLPLARLSAGRLPAAIWRGLALALLLSALSDGLIALAVATDRLHLRPLIISVFSSAALLAIGTLALLPAATGVPDAPAPDTPTPTEADGALAARLDRLLKADRLYLEPDLTLTRLARRLHVPAKALSAAINRVTGDNVSRHVNGFRIRHACARLDDGHSVTAAMLDSGFATKSNFNREFLRLTGTTPSAWSDRRTSSTNCIQA